MNACGAGSVNCRARGLLSLCAGILLLGGAILPASGLAATSGIDAVLIVDSSGSMKETDPRRLRVPAAKMFLSLLGEQDRVGLISFSDNGYPVLHLTAAGKRQQDKLFAAADKVSAKGAYTNLHAALIRGQDMLRDEADPQRRRMLILMSDGKMDTGDFAQDQILADKIRNETLAELAKDGVEVYTIAFTEASDMALMREMSQRTAALSRLASNDRELHEVFSQIFESAKQPDMLPIEGGEFMVDTAVEEITVVASKAAADVDVGLVTPDGRSLGARNAGAAVRWFKSEQFDMITVDKPQAGAWRLVSSDNRGDRVYVVTNLSLEAQLGEAAAFVGAEQQAEAWLHENGQVIDKPEIVQNTVFSLEIVQPEGETLELSMADAGADSDRAAGDGVFSAAPAFTVPGQHRIRVLAKNPNFERTKTLMIDAVTADAIETVISEPLPTPEPVTEAPPIEIPPIIEETIREEAPPEPGVNIGLLVALFVLANLIVAAGIGGILFWRKRKVARVAAAADVDEDDAK
ncbi:MAG: vWA domain-containing protein [Thiohalobacteraceae bacterium]